MSVQALVTAAKRALGGRGDHAPAEPMDAEVIDALPARATTTAAADVIERADETVIVLDVPGATRRSTDITVAGNRLEVLARRTDTLDAGALNWQRWFVISDAIDSGRARADVREGVLTIHLPKRAAAKPHRIRVRRPGVVSVRGARCER